MAALAMNFMSLKSTNPEMTDAYFYQKHLYSPFGFGKCLPKCKGQVVVWETKPILKEALICTGQFQIQFTKKKLQRYHLIVDKGKNKFQVL
jgi:hypothetical protein